MPTPKPISIAATICPYCAVGCGAIVRHDGGKLLAVEGDPEHAVNRGALCAKGTLMVQAANSPRRITTVRYRAPGAADWQEKTWDWAIAQIAAKIRAARDRQRASANAAGGLPLAMVGGPTLDNAACGQLRQFARDAGIGLLDNQVRLSHGATIAALRATFGRGGFDSRPEDFEKAGCILILGGNPAENHPVAMHWIMRAKDRGARLVVVDPRLTRTAAVADLHVPLCCGTDLAIVGMLVRETLVRGRLDRDYLVKHTDAIRLLRPADGHTTGVARRWRYDVDAAGTARQDATLTDPACALEHVRQWSAAFKLDDVAAVCGTPPAALRQLADWFVAAERSRPGTIVVGQGVAQHTAGTQTVRGVAILQMLLGNMAAPGGGIVVFGSEANQRGAVDAGLLSATDPAALGATAGLPGGAGLGGLIVLGENPAVCAPDAAGLRAALDKLPWLVVMDSWETETAAFWKRPGAKSADIATEVFLLPAADSLECDGSTTNALGMVQTRHAVVPPAGASQTPLRLLEQLHQALALPHSPAVAAAPPPAVAALCLADGPRAPQAAAMHYLPESLDEIAKAAGELTARIARARQQGQPAIVAMIVRIGEHSQTSLMTRNVPWLVEMVPTPLVEISRSLARQKGIRNGELVVVRSAQGEIKLPALATDRLRPLKCRGVDVEQVAIVGNFGYCGLATGPTAAALAPLSFDAASGTPAMQGFLVDVVKV